MTYHILIPDNLNPAGIDLLRAVPEFDVTAGSLSREAVLAAIGECHALIVRSATKADAELLAAAPRLKVITRAGVGVDNVDLPTAAARGIVVMNAPDSNTIAAAEHTLALMLALSRNIPTAHQAMREGRWDRKRFMGVELRGKTLGVIGLGRTGQAVTHRALAFGMTVLAHDPYQDPAAFAEAGATAVALDDLLTRSDYISLHAPVNDETRDLIDAARIAQMKDGVRIVNTARGALINAADLAAAIRDGKVAGAALDVYEVEPPPADHPLVGLEGVIHTPHLGASTYEAQIAVAVQAAEQVRDALLKGEYRNVVSAENLNPFAVS